MPLYYRNRRDAGAQLATHLGHLKGRHDVVVLGLPRGGVPVAAEVARALAAPLDVCLVRKLGVPGHEELAMGAIAEGGTEVVSETLLQDLGLPRSIVEAAAARERIELDRRARLYRTDRSALSPEGRIVILVDDGLATGATMEAAVHALRARKPARIIAAAPVGAREACERLASVADEVVCPRVPEPFSAVGQWYADFSETSDQEVRSLLNDGVSNGEAP